jgi:sec-independent protein translocase protein TatA
MGIENPTHLLFIAVVALVVLGPKRLPGLARALGHGIREFREAVSQGGQAPAEPAAQPPAATAAQRPTVDPTQQVRSADAPDRGPL